MLPFSLGFTTQCGQYKSGHLHVSFGGRVETNAGVRSLGAIDPAPSHSAGAMPFGENIGVSNKALPA